jgi:pimeloyl-ACP methyl ester carboxylesterase
VIALRIVVGLLTALVVAVAGYGLRNLRYAGVDAARVQRAGFAEKQTTINRSRLNYGEGPDNGPPLVLIHGQVSDWQGFSRALPALSRRYHVFAVDCYGHGGSARDASKYTAVALAGDARWFIDEVVGAPAIVAGHSSGGLIAAKLAADAPDVVRGVVLEDPPFFSSVLPRAVKTFNYVGLATTAHEFLDSDDYDFTAYFIRHAAIWKLFGGLAGPLQRMGLSYRARHPGTPVKFVALPPTFNELFRAMDSYDPLFGQAFYDDRFNAGFDHGRTLAEIAVPTALIHTTWSYDDDGVLLAAMDGDDAQRAQTLLRDVAFYDVDTGHGFHFEDPTGFVRIVDGLANRIAERSRTAR